MTAEPSRIHERRDSIRVNPRSGSATANAAVSGYYG